jgi:hypothetical protein
VLVIGEGTSRERSWNDMMGKLKYSEKNLFKCNIVNHISHVDWTEIKPGPPSDQ